MKGLLCFVWCGVIAACDGSPPGRSFLAAPPPPFCEMPDYTAMDGVFLVQPFPDMEQRVVDSVDACVSSDVACYASPVCDYWFAMVPGETPTFEEILAVSGWLDDRDPPGCSEAVLSKPVAYRCEDHPAGPIDVFVWTDCSTDVTYYTFAPDGRLVSIVRMRYLGYSHPAWCCAGHDVALLIAGEVVDPACDNPAYYTPDDFG